MFEKLKNWYAVRNARARVYKHMKEHTPSKQTPTYHYINFEPNKYWTRTWSLKGNEMIVRTRFIKADLIEVYRNGQEVAAWVDQDHQYGIGLNDFSCSNEFFEFKKTGV